MSFKDAMKFVDGLRKTKEPAEAEDPSKRRFAAFKQALEQAADDAERAKDRYAQMMSQTAWGSRRQGMSQQAALGALEGALYGVDYATHAQCGIGATQWIPQVPAGDAASTPSEVPQPSPPAASPRPVCALCPQEMVRSFKRGVRRDGKYEDNLEVCGDCAGSQSLTLKPRDDLDTRIAAARPDDTDPTSGWTAGATPGFEWP